MVGDEAEARSRLSLRYDKAAIVEWLAKKQASPVTGAPIDPSILIPNHLVRSQIREFLDKCKELVPPDRP